MLQAPIFTENRVGDRKLITLRYRGGEPFRLMSNSIAVASV